MAFLTLILVKLFSPGWNADEVSAYTGVSKHRGNACVEDQLHADLAVRRRRRPCRYRICWSELREMP